MKAYGSGCRDTHFRDLGTSWRWVVHFTFRPLYSRGRIPGTHWIRGWVDLRAGLGDLEKWNFLTLPGLKLRPLSRPACNQSLYRLRYPGSFKYSKTSQNFIEPPLYTSVASILMLSATYIQVFLVFSLLLAFPQNSACIHLRLTCAISPVHLILLDLITVISFSKCENLWSSSKCNFLVSH
jgi:hypothetical protein